MPRASNPCSGHQIHAPGIKSMPSRHQFHAPGIKSMLPGIKSMLKASNPWSRHQLHAPIIKFMLSRYEFHAPGIKSMLLGIKSMLGASNPCSGHQIHARGIKSMLLGIKSTQNLCTDRPEVLTKYGLCGSSIKYGYETFVFILKCFGCSGYVLEYSLEVLCVYWWCCGG